MTDLQADHVCTIAGFAGVSSGYTSIKRARMYRVSRVMGLDSGKSSPKRRCAWPHLGNMLKSRETEHGFFTVDGCPLLEWFYRSQSSPSIRDLRRYTQSRYGKTV